LGGAVDDNQKKGLGTPLSFVITRAGTYGIDISAIALRLRMHFRIIPPAVESVAVEPAASGSLRGPV
jgi:hypothetical protein